MQQILANPLGALAQADTLMRGKQQSRLADLQLQAAEKRQQLGTLLPQAMKGDARATQEIAEIDPKLFMDLDENQRTVAAQRSSQFASMLAGVEQTPAPLRQAAYNQARKEAIQLGADETGIPQAYDSAWVQSRYNSARKIEDILKAQPGVGPEGKGVGPWAIRTLLNGDPSSPEYAAAYADYSKPKTQLVQTDNGMAPVEVKPDMSAYRSPGATAQVNASVEGTSLGGPMPPPDPGLPGVIPGTDKPPTEDQAKAGGWYRQATNAYQNMMGAIEKDPGASKPTIVEKVVGGIAGTEGKNAVTSPQRQRYINAASEFSEAVLRAATGAGVTIDEAKQKIEALTPGYFDSPELIKQKQDGMRQYLDSLKIRAGRTAKGVPAPKSNDNDPLGLFQ